MRRKTPPPRPTASAVQALAQLTDAIQDLVSLLNPIGGTKELTYDHAIGWFVDNRPPGEIVGGALLRSPAQDGRTEIIQVFLTRDNQVAADRKGVPYGRRFVVDRIDDELTESFGNTALLIVN